MLLCRGVRLFLSRHGDGGLFWFNIEIHKYLLLHPWNEIHKSLNFYMSVYRSFRERSPSLISILESSLQLARSASTLDLSAASLYRGGSFFIS